MSGDRIDAVKAAFANLTGGDTTLTGQFARFRKRENIVIIHQFIPAWQRGLLRHTRIKAGTGGGQPPYSARLTVSDGDGSPAAVCDKLLVLLPKSSLVGEPPMNHPSTGL